MNIIIAGMGVVGRHVALALAQERHNLVLLDLDTESLERAGSEIDAMTIKGHVANERTLLQAGVKNCDLFMAVTNMDEVNFIAALRAKHLNPKLKTIARATDPVYFEEEHGLYTDMFGIDLVINPKFLVAMEIHKLIRTRGAVEVEDFANNQIEMIQLRIKDETRVTGRPLREVRQNALPPNVLLVAILSRGELVIPSGADTLHVGDEVLCIGLRDEIPKVEEVFGLKRSRSTRRVIVVGGGDIGTSLARNLTADGIRVSIIERDYARARYLSETLSGVDIEHGDGTDAHLLEELGVSTCDVFVAVSHEDELNLMTSLLAKEMGARRCISLTHKPDYTQVLKRLGVDATLSPRQLVASEVLKHVRQDHVLSTTMVMGGRGEFMQVHVPDGALITRYPVKELGWPRGSLICAGFDAQGAFIPDGNRIIQAGQRIVVFTTPKTRSKLKRFFLP
jgi:trk system potassium uptake protein TrkA